MPFGGIVVSSTEALSPDSIPKKLVVVGGGYIGLELGTVYRKGRGGGRWKRRTASCPPTTPS